MHKQVGCLLLTLLLVCVEARAGSGVSKGEPVTLTHDRAIETALRQNPDILLAKQEIERTYGVVIEVRAQALPHATATADYEQQDRELFKARGLEGSQEQTLDPGLFSQLLGGSGGGGAGAGAPATSGTTIINNNIRKLVIEIPAGQGSRSVIDKNWRIALEVRQVIYAGGQVRAAINLAKITQDISYFQLRDTIDRVIAQVRQQFYLVLLNRSLIRVQEESLQLVEQQLQDQRNRFEAGTVARFNVLRAEVEVASVRPDLIRAQNAYRISQWRLAKQLGIQYDEKDPASSPINVVGEWQTPPDPAPLQQLIASAREERALLKIQRANIASSREQIKIAQAGYKPRVDVGGGYQLRNSSVSTDPGDSVYGWYFGVTGSWNVFDGFETYGKVKQARALLERTS